MVHVRTPSAAPAIKSMPKDSLRQIQFGMHAATTATQNRKINEWKDADGSIQVRDAHSDLGGTMRLGAQSSDVKPGTLAHEIYGDVVTERHRHRYEANVNYLDQLGAAGLVISAITQREKLTEIVELPRSVHPWFMGVQFHPEFKSTPWDGHPLFNAYIKAALDQQSIGKTLKVVA